MIIKKIRVFCQRLLMEFIKQNPRLLLLKGEIRRSKMNLRIMLTAYLWQVRGHLYQHRTSWIKHLSLLIKALYLKMVMKTSKKQLIESFPCSTSTILLPIMHFKIQKTLKKKRCSSKLQQRIFFRWTNLTRKCFIDQPQ